MKYHEVPKKSHLNPDNLVILLITASDVVKLLSDFKSLLTSMKENNDGKEDLEQIIKEVEETPSVDVKKLGTWSKTDTKQRVQYAE